MNKSTRRRFLGGMVAAAGGVLGAKTTFAGGWGSPAAMDDGPDPVLSIGENIAVAATKHGLVRGFVREGIFNFRGIPYGADTSAGNRFRPPQPPESWHGVRPAIAWGDVAPQNLDGHQRNPYGSFLFDWNVAPVSEDCLRLNVWTPGLDPAVRRPVLVWLHGGGFSGGNAVELASADGQNLTRFGDIVFCSLNHRLGPFGFTNLAAQDDAYKLSGNAGMLDIVAGLEWVRDNIAAFGGDAGNVTVIGQSGGGFKVCTLAAMPAARGLLHKAVVLSGSAMHGAAREYSERLGGAVLAEAGLERGDIARLQRIPWQDYLQIAQRADWKLKSRLLDSSARSPGFGPVADGIVLPEGSFFADPVGIGAEVPMIVSTTLNERSPSREDASLETISLDGVRAALREKLGGRTDAVIAAYAEAFPGSKPVELWSFILSNRLHSVALADAKAAQTAPVWMGWFHWQSPLFDGRARAFHTLDIGFWMHNTDRMPTHTGGGGRPRALAARLAKSLVQFMRSGDPNGAGLPPWPRYTARTGAVMILDDDSVVRPDFDREARATLPRGVAAGAPAYQPVVGPLRWKDAWA